MFTNRQCTFYTVMAGLMTYLLLGTMLREAIPIAFHTGFLIVVYGMVGYSWFDRKP